MICSPDSLEDQDAPCLLSNTLFCMCAEGYKSDECLPMSKYALDLGDITSRPLLYEIKASQIYTCADRVYII